MSDTRDADLDFLSKALIWLGDKDRDDAVDAVYCELHNRGQQLAGNTPESDVDWFARLIWAEQHENDPPWHFDDFISGKERQRYIELSEIVIRIMPRLMSRVADRSIAWAAACHTILRERAAVEKGERKR
jgi:hypothetical protein